MSALQDFLSLFAGCIALFAVNSRAEFGLTLIVGIALGALCWFACSRYSRLWNLRYRVTFTHHLFCALAAILTLLFTVVFIALRYTKEAAYASVQAWEADINHDDIWAETTFATAWQKVKSSGLEDFSKVPAPGMPDSQIPMNTPASIHLAAAVYATCSAENFTKNRPFLSKILQAHTELPAQVLDAEVNSYFATKGNTYPLDRAISLVVSEIKSQLDDQLPGVVTTFRSLAAGSFLCVQCIPFGLVAIAAFKKLKLVT
jgi:hypothetical protein